MDAGISRRICTYRRVGSSGYSRANSVGLSTMRAVSKWSTWRRRKRWATTTPSSGASITRRSNSRRSSRRQRRRKNWRQLQGHQRTTRQHSVRCGSSTMPNTQLTVHSGSMSSSSTRRPSPSSTPGQRRSLSHWFDTTSANGGSVVRQRRPRPASAGSCARSQLAARGLTATIN